MDKIKVVFLYKIISNIKLEIINLCIREINLEGKFVYFSSNYFFLGALMTKIPSELKLEVI